MEKYMLVVTEIGHWCAEPRMDVTAMIIRTTNGKQFGAITVQIKYPVEHTGTWDLAIVRRVGVVNVYWTNMCWTNLPIAVKNELSEKVVRGLPDEFTELETLRVYCRKGDSLLDIPFNWISCTKTLCVASSWLEIAPAIPLPWTEHLAALDLNDNYLTSLPPEIGLMRLSSLDISFNRFADIPPCVAGLAGSLVSFKITGNMVTRLPPFIWTLHALEHLDVGENALSGHIPSGIKSLSSLRTLFVDTNKDLESLPYTLWGAGRLTKLGVWGTRITSLPGSLRLLPALSIHPSTFKVEPLHWHTRYHAHFPLAVRRMIRTFCVCNFRFLLPYLPREMLWAIFEYLLYE